MKKFVVAVILGASLVLGGCGFQSLELEYEGKTYTEDRVEEHIEDILEDQNPGYDLEVDIYEEAE